MDLNKLFAKSIGKSIFIMYYEYFENTQYSDEYIIENILPRYYIDKNGKEKKYTTLKTRVKAARAIFESNNQIEALKICLTSKRLPNKIREKAKKILENL